MINPDTGWFGIIKVTTFDFDKIMGGNYEYINKSSTRLIQLSNKTWLIIYLCTHKVTFRTVSEFKLDLTPLLYDFDVKAIFATLNNPHTNTKLERVHQIIYNMLVTIAID